MSDTASFAQRVDEMDDEDREHFKEVINALSYCYSQEGKKALVIVESASGLCETMTINCDDTEAYSLANSTAQYLHFVNTADAPPKEKFN